MPSKHKIEYILDSILILIHNLIYFQTLPQDCYMWALGVTPVFLSCE